MQLLTRDIALHFAVLHPGYPDCVHRAPRGVLYGLPQDVCRVYRIKAVQYRDQEVRGSSMHRSIWRKPGR